MTEPQPPISSKPPCTREDALLVVKRLRENGHVSYFAGGCVRDELLGIQPKDYDVATDAPPSRVQELFRNTQAVGAAFGVILVRLGKSVIEVATFRTDGAYLDGRRPSNVQFTTAEEDAKRRDFTINGLFFDPIENKVIDYVGGQEDLQKRILRAIGDAVHRFEEDHLRLLRAIRFAARFDLNIDPDTRAAIAKETPKLVRISPERIAQELRLILSPPSRIRAWKLIQQFDIDEIILRFLQLPWPLPHPEIGGHRKNILFDKVSPGRPIPFGLALATAVLEYSARRLPHLSEWKKLHEDLIVRQAVRALRQALRISNEEADAVEGALYGLAIVFVATPPSLAALKRFLARPTANTTRQLMCAISDAGVLRQTIEPLEQQLSELEKNDYAPAPFITGDDLTAAGLQPGKLFKRILNDVYDAQLESRVNSKEQAMELALRLSQEK